MNQLLRPVDASWLAAFRCLFGAAMFVSMVRFVTYGWVDRFFVQPKHHFKYWALEWVQPLNHAGMHALFWGLAGLALMMALGLFYRWAAVLFSVGLIFFQVIDVTTYLNHYYLAALLSLILAVSPAGRTFSVDNLLFKTKPNRADVPVVWLYLLRFQVGVVYVFAGLAKFNADWLLHAQPLRIWLSAKTDLPVLGQMFAREGVPLAMSWAGFLFDTTIVAWLSWRKSRPCAYAVVLLFHALTRVIFPIGMFPVIMTIAALVFFEPTWPRTLAARAMPRIMKWRPSPSISGGGASDLAASPPAVAGAPGHLRFHMLLAVALLYCGVQVALPLRAAFYDGNVLWHEQGMRFSWRVMLRAKGGTASFVVREGNGGRVAHVEPRRYLTDLQESEMVSQPDLILQTAKMIEADYARRGWKDISVFVDSLVSLNGRRSARLVEPDVDLTQVSDGLGRYEWIAQGPQEAPQHTRPVL